MLTNIDVKKIVNESIDHILYESMQNLVDNFDMVGNLINLTDPDKFFYVQIMIRWKDNKDKGMVKKTDGTYHGGAEYGNYANGTAFKVRSKADLMALKPKIVSICNKLNARAYVTSNPRSDSDINGFIQQYKQRFRNNPNDPRVQHAEEILAGQTKGGDIWKTERPRFFFDIDTTDKRIWELTKLILKYYNIPIEGEYQTPSEGLHIIISDRNLKDVDKAIYTLRLFNGPLYQHLINKFQFGNDGKFLNPSDANWAINIIMKALSNGNSKCFPTNINDFSLIVHANFDGKIILYSNVITSGY